MIGDSRAFRFRARGLRVRATPTDFLKSGKHMNRAIPLRLAAALALTVFFLAAALVTFVGSAAGRTAARLGYRSRPGTPSHEDSASTAARLPSAPITAPTGQQRLAAGRAQRRASRRRTATAA